MKRGLQVFGSQKLHSNLPPQIPAPANSASDEVATFFGCSETPIGPASFLSEDASESKVVSTITAFEAPQAFARPSRKMSQDAFSKVNTFRFTEQAIHVFVPLK